MDLLILKKRISSFRTEGGHLRSVSDEVLGQLLHAWENWTGPALGFYRTIGVDHRKVASLIRKAKRLKREGALDSIFTEVKVEHPVQSASIKTCTGIEIHWEQNKVIRFPRVDQLIEFLKKTGNMKKAA